MKTTLGKIALLGLLSASLSLSANAASLSVYISAPGEQETFIPDAPTETWDAPLSTGPISGTYTSEIGDYDFSNPANIHTAGLYGGANGSQYISIGVGDSSNGPYVLNLTTPANYFGFWFSAGDVNNNLTFYKNGVQLATFSTATILTLLNNPTGQVIPINHLLTPYDSADYFGNPNIVPPNNNPAEPYAYVNIFAQGLTFDSIVFDNNHSSNTGFESDNHSIYRGAVAPDGASVFVTTIDAVPEPSAVALLSALAIGFILWKSRKRVA